MTLDEVMTRVGEYPTDLVEITGGEPLLQPAVLPLITEFLDQGKEVIVETGGSLDVGPVDPRARLIYDVKCPESGMSDRNCWENLGRLKPGDEVKFVLNSREDYDWAKARVEEWDLASQHTVLFSPVWEHLSPRELADWVLEDGLSVRLQLQLHKVLWGGEARGV